MELDSLARLVTRMRGRERLFLAWTAVFLIVVYSLVGKAGDGGKILVLSEKHFGPHLFYPICVVLWGWVLVAGLIIIGSGVEAAAEYVRKRDAQPELADEPAPTLTPKAALRSTDGARLDVGL